MARVTTTDRRWSGWASLVVASAAVITGVLLGGTHLLLPDKKSKTTHSILMIFAKEAFDWSSSTTPAPLSATAVAVKAILGGKSDGALAQGLENAVLSTAEPDGSSRAVDVKVGPVRDFISARVLREVKHACSPLEGGGSSSSSSSSSPCDPNEVDPEFGTTPLHLAELWGSSELVEYLLSIGASPDAFDTVGRQPRNMTFKAFSANSKKAADTRLPSLPDSASAAAGDLGMPQDDEMRCEIPEVTIPLFSTADGDDAAEPDDHGQWQSSALAALAEVRRLVSEGEPVMVRNVVPWLQQQEKKQLRFPDAASFAEAWGHRPVDVGGVPYAKNFELFNERTTLSDYMQSTTTTAAASATDSSGRENDQEATSPAPNYVFQVDTEACAEGRDLLGTVVDAALPSSGDRPIVCPPPGGLRGLESVHYYLGGRHSGAPFHIHSDALNLAVSGRKRWWVVTPREAVWSRRHIRDYAEEGKGGPPASGEDRPMECVQRGGDLVYVPGDWGHAAMNLEDGTFGYTLELVNRRDTLASVLGMGCEQ
ncbi:unnamed protein product [Ectocarpus sp. 12 AP-2014]